MLALEEGALEPTTKKRYRYAARKFARFLLSLGLSARELPAGLAEGWVRDRESLAALLRSEVIVASFLGFSFAGEFAYSTAKGDLSGLRALCVCAGGGSFPPGTDYIRKLLKGYRKLVPAGSGSAVLSQQVWLQMLHAVDAAVGHPSTPRYGVEEGVLLKAILVVAFTACLRSGEYTGGALTWGDVALSAEARALLKGLEAAEVDPRGAEAWLRKHGRARAWVGVLVELTLRHTKASPSKPVSVLVFPNEGATGPCAVSALLAHMYVAERPALKRSGKEQPVFRSYLPSHGALRGGVSRQWVGAKLAGLAALVGVDEAVRGRLKPHSLRKGGATAAALGGASNEEIKTLGRWKSDAFRVYVVAACMRMRRAQRAVAAAVAQTAKAWGVGRV